MESHAHARQRTWRWRCMTRDPAWARKRRARSSSRRSPSRSAGWDWACRSPRRTRCAWAATSCSWTAGSAAPASGSCFPRTSSPVFRPATHMTRKHRITIVDDEPNIGLSLRLILEREGYAVTICGSVAEFQAQRSPGRADLYLLRRAPPRRQRHRSAPRDPPERRRHARGHDLRARHHPRRRRGHAQRGLRLSGEAAGSRPGAACGEERARALRSAAREPALPRARRRRRRG